MTAATPPSERRRFQRIDVDLPAIVRTVAGELSATVRRISRTGADVELGRAASAPTGDWVVLAGVQSVLRGCDARVVATDGAHWRLAFDPALPALDLLGIAKLLG